MQSQGSTSSQPSSDSLSSSDSFIFSDSELAEDDADVFLTDSSPSVIIGSRGGVNTDSGTAPASPGSQWASDGFTDREEEGESDRSESGSGGRLGTEELDAASCTHRSQGDLLFAQKCAELQGFIRPLLELLHGLKKGRFDRGLSSFQQSVAMDRIQRIVGVLQRPKGGEKYLNTLLQVEMMLKMWFPQISTSLPSTATSTSPAVMTQNVAGCTPPHKHRDQLHIPVKKRRLSWTGNDSPAPSPMLVKRRHMNGEEKTGRQGDDDRGSPQPLLDADVLHNHQDLARASRFDRESQGKNCDSEESRESSSYQAGHCSEPYLTWVHVAPILSPPKACTPHKGTATSENGKQLLAANPPPLSMGSPATQDSAISSTTPNKHPKSQKKPIQCQSQPVAGEKTESETSETYQGQSQSSPVVGKPLARVCPAPLET